MKNLLIFPFGGNAREILPTIIEINKLQPTWRVIGFLDDNKDLWGEKLLDITVLGGSLEINKYPNSFILAIPGNPENYLNRPLIISKLGIHKSKQVTIIDPSARVSADSTVGKNSVLMANVVISTGVKIGNHCIILANTVIAHDTIIEDYCVIGSNVTISGYCTIKKNSYIGSASSIKEKISIGQRSLIGIGSNIISDMPANIIAVGNPAKIIRSI